MVPGQLAWSPPCTATLPGMRPVATQLAQVGLVGMAGNVAGTRDWSRHFVTDELTVPPLSPVPSRIAGRGLINIQSCFQV